MITFLLPDQAIEKIDAWTERGTVETGEDACNEAIENQWNWKGEYK